MERRSSEIVLTLWIGACFDACSDQHELTDTITCYIKFSEETVIASKIVKVFSNNKPWLSKDLKMCLNEKRAAFLRGEADLVKRKRRTSGVKFLQQK